jgi:transposase-like protein
MPKSHPPYAPEVRRQMVELVRSGRTPEELSREFEPTAQAIWNWVRQTERDAGRRDDGLSGGGAGRCFHWWKPAIFDPNLSAAARRGSSAR